MSRPVLGLRAIFEQAFGLESPVERERFLAEVCGDRADLRAEVEGLLRAHGEVGSFLEGSDLIATALWDDPARPEAPGAAIGPYALGECLGAGGMGVVYRAEQNEPVRRTVALKLIRPGMDSAQVVARFEAERQALAIMDHPNIARVLDAGSDEMGRPYFVMELVEGVPITDYCDRARLPIRDRLELFVLVCRAVQHAHQKGVIHRDLKPSNVLVVEQDGAPVPKVIDFGVAKAMGQALTDKTLTTAFHQFIGTPLYMSPEQAGVNGHDVDTRSDVYSLGVLLYELLTGTTPFEPNRLKQAAFDEVCRMIREEEPARPSTRLSTLTDADRSGLSERRGTDPRHLARALHGELDWIVLKCLEKERARRYESAGDLAGDLMRYLTDRPIEARPPSVGYRLRKLARRHRLSLTAGLLVLLSMIAGTAVSAWEATRAEVARREAAVALVRAEEHLALARQAVDELYGEAATRWSSTLDTEVAPLPARLLDRALPFYQRFAQRSDDAAALRARLRVGEIFFQLQRYDEAESNLQRAETGFRELLAAQPDDRRLWSDLATTLCYLSNVKGCLRRMEDAVTCMKQALVIRTDLLRRDPDDAENQEQLAIVLHTLACFDWWARRWADAEERFERTLRLQTQLANDNPAEPNFRLQLGQTIRDIGNVRRDRGRAEEGETYQRRAVAIHEPLVAQHPTRPRYLLNLAWDYWELGRTHWAQGKYAEMPDVSSRAATIFEGLANDFPEAPAYQVYAASSLSQAAVAKLRIGERAEAERIIRRIEALGTAPFAWRPGDQVGAGSLNDIAWHLVQRETPGGTDPARALRLVDRILDARIGPPGEIGAWHIRGMALYRLGRFDEAIASLRKVHELEHDAGFAFNGFFIAMCHQRKGDTAMARDWFDRSVAWMTEKQSTDPFVFKYRDEAAEVLELKLSRMPTGPDAFAR